MTKFQMHIVKQQLFLFLLWTFLVFFRAPTVEGFISLVVNPVFAKVESSNTNDITLIVLVLILIAYYIRRIISGYIGSSEAFALAIYFAISYWYYRCVDEAIFDFRSFQFSSSLFYCDMFFVPALLEIIAMSRSLFRSRKISKEAKYALILDEPIEFQNQDQLGFDKDVEALGRHIYNTNGDEALAIAICGKWGSGKTSFINLLSRKLTEYPNVLVHEYKPWVNPSAQGVMADFFNELISITEKFDSVLKWHLRKYAKTLGGFTNPYSEFLFEILNPIWPKSLTEQYQLLNQGLKATGKEIVMIIDDLDRLSDSEVQSVLTLVRSTASFSSLKFIVAFDDHYILQAVKNQNPHNYARFLDKIFSFKHSLYPPDARTLRNILAGYLIEAFPENKDEIEAHIVGDSHLRRGLSIDILGTIRDAKRLANTLVVESKKLSGEVLLIEYMKIQLIRERASLVYSDLALKKDQWFENKNVYTPILGLKENVFADYLKESKTSYDLEDSDIQFILMIVKSLFNKHHYFGGTSSEGYLSITNPTRFYVYFSSQLRSGHLSESGFESARRLDFKMFLDKIDNWLNEGLGFELLKRFERLDIKELKTADEFEKTIRANWYTAKNEQRLGIGLNARNMLYKLSSNDYINKLYSDREQYAKFLESLLKEPPFNKTTEVAFIRHASELANSEFALSRSQLFEIAWWRFTNFLSDYQTIEPNVFWDLFHTSYAVEKQLRAEDSVNFLLDSKVLALVLPVIEKRFLIEFIVGCIAVDHHDRLGYTISNGVLNFFIDYNSFIDFFKREIFDQNDYVLEFRNFIKKAGAKSFGHWVNFEFELIPVAKPSH